MVPAVDGYSSAILKYRTALAKYFPGEAPDYVSLEGYVDGTVLLEGLNGPVPSPIRKLVDRRNYDMGSAGSSLRQASGPQSMGQPLDTTCHS